MKHPIKRALISVSDKEGIIPFALALHKAGVEIISTGGTAQLLKGADIPCRDVAEITQWAEMMDGRVKTLHPAIHGGLLARRDKPDHTQAMDTHNIPAIDLLVVNLYPFEAVLDQNLDNNTDGDTHIENIDIGGPAMIRGAAKNHAFVSVVVEAADYDLILDALQQGGTDLRQRQYLAQKAFARVAAYDAAISNWMAGAFPKCQEGAQDWFAIGGRLKEALRYGENPHQQAAFYATAPKRLGLAAATQHQGKALSYNNINDADAAFALIREFPACEAAAVCIIKHANPCGVALADNLGDDLAGAFARALACDPVSAFGGIIATNRPLDKQAAEAMTAIFTEVIIAPAADAEAKSVIAAKKNLRLLTLDYGGDSGKYKEDEHITPHIRSVAGGFLYQNQDKALLDKIECVTKRQPSDQEMQDLLFAWKIAKHVKSNAIIYAKDTATVGIGAGQMSRLDSATIAAHKAEVAAKNEGLAEPLTKGSVAASDAFFPFADGLLAIAAAGSTAIIQPGGSVRDAEVIAAADDKNIAMVFTNMRHFRH
ncbi:MAG: bifunctional phosphoribosylaminoimidazolecarboxamide formyltransferase/IMP cyclohydrolase [Alphaproteobacteria bacterium]|nr:bifunctional phosphoribosylaminoimidazolecarboxamide formyltransferase/IMP cyclohydrolase [Alphaproteobacteria bacterium]